ncbi:LAGLIDADG family homing endonuclease [Mesobacillus jeotgali]|uniref:LAGLIDADG family homing endonuclease n=1 Tax=Mesobacillus jeotgali TaxID=129985 RepID=UPI00177E991F|nr:LAGLIDADG family homing endonuclease [Mesobacillus jeotgali]UYZ23301.1 hypothetical protein FOF60_07095 [Mesobacillus jeotgali]
MIRKFLLDENFFGKITTEEKAYWLGFILADGSVSKENRRNCITLSLSRKDKEHLYKFKKSIKATYDIKDKIVYLKAKEHSILNLGYIAKK